MGAVRAVVLAILAFFLAPGCFESVISGAGPTDPYDYIRDDDYTSWLIEVDWVQGERPSQAAIDTLRSRLGELVEKDQIVVRVSATALAVGDGSWSDNEVLALAKQTQDHKRGDGQVVTHVLYLDGRYAENDEGTVFGVTYDYDVIAIFSESIDTQCTAGRLCFDEQRVETAVLVHEFGHALGLVNRGIPMERDHQDEAHGAHSDNEDSVMYYAVESLGSGVPFLDNIPTTFDADDKRDVCAAGGRC